jgi:hypothetical protein
VGGSKKKELTGTVESVSILCQESVDGPGELTDSPPVGRVIVLQGQTRAIRHLKTENGIKITVRCQTKNFLKFRLYQIRFYEYCL